ncbi:unnamed protein product, partial [Hapterophycus canaliculatus]
LVPVPQIPSSISVRPWASQVVTLTFTDCAFVYRVGLPRGGRVLTRRYCRVSRAPFLTAVATVSSVLLGCVIFWSVGLREACRRSVLPLPWLRTLVCATPGERVTRSGGPRTIRAAEEISGELLREVEGNGAR